MQSGSVDSPLWVLEGTGIRSLSDSQIAAKGGELSKVEWLALNVGYILLYYLQCRWKAEIKVYQYRQ